MQWRIILTKLGATVCDIFLENFIFNIFENKIFLRNENDVKTN